MSRIGSNFTRSGILVYIELCLEFLKKRFAVQLNSLSKPGNF